MTQFSIGNKFGKKNRGKVPWNKGKKLELTIEQRKKWASGVRGKKHWKWRGGITSENNKIRHSIEYRLWRISVFERDKYTCIWCGIKGSQTGGYLQADHIKPFAYYPELRFAIDNGRTLCRDCHRKTHTYGKKDHVI